MSASLEMYTSDEETLRSEILETSHYFTSMMELIPAKHYVEDFTTEEDMEHIPKKKKKKKQQVLNKKLLAKKAKLLKLDPANHKSITELQKEVEEKEKAFFQEDSETVNEVKPIKVSECPSSSIDDLRGRLHAKMEVARGKRKILDSDEKVALKKARLDKKNLNAKKKKTQKETDQIKRVTNFEDASLSKVRNDKGDLVFSKFDFADDTETGKHKKVKKTDMKKLLGKAEGKKKKFEELKASDADAAKKVLEKDSWDSAVKKAEGHKIKDDPKLLKKSIKRKEKQKEKSRKAWKEREESVANSKKEKQKKRVQNMQDRKQSKMDKKSGKSKKHTKQKKKHKPGF